MKAYVVTHVEHDWDNILAVFTQQQDAKDWIDWYCDYCETPKDCLILHSRNLRDKFEEEL